MFVNTCVDKAKSVNVATSNLLAAACVPAVKSATVAANAVGVAFALSIANSQLQGAVRDLADWPG